MRLQEKTNRGNMENENIIKHLEGVPVVLLRFPRFDFKMINANGGMETKQENILLGCI